jgi:hypothetical protein
MPLPEFVAQQVNRLLTAYCEKRVPAHVRDEVRLEHKTRGNKVYLVERRPYWRDASAEWTEQPVARVDYQPASAQWALYCADRNGRWHRYDRLKPTHRFDTVLEEIERDPTGIFWG